MSTLLIKNIPVEIKQKLSEQAERNHRSLNKETILRLEQSLAGRGIGPLPPPFKAKVRFSSDWVTKAVKRGRR